MHSNNQMHGMYPLIPIISNHRQDDHLFSHIKEAISSVLSSEIKTIETKFNQKLDDLSKRIEQLELVKKVPDSSVKACSTVAPLVDTNVTNQNYIPVMIFGNTAISNSERPNTDSTGAVLLPELKSDSMIVNIEKGSLIKSSDQDAHSKFIIGESELSEEQATKGKILVMKGSWYKKNADAIARKHFETDHEFLCPVNTKIVLLQDVTAKLLYNDIKIDLILKAGQTFYL
jgi:hypothetical protein